VGIAGRVVEVVEASIPDLLGILMLICHFGQNGVASGPAGEPDQTEGYCLDRSSYVEVVRHERVTHRQRPK
jgi:hypothetical protein